MKLYFPIFTQQTSFQAFLKTRTAISVNPNWNQKFELDEIGGGEYLKIKCFGVDIFGDENIGTARVNLEGLHEGIVRDVWVPLEKVNYGELRLMIEAVKADDYEGSRVWFITIHHDVLSSCQKNNNLYMFALLKFLMESNL